MRPLWRDLILQVWGGDPLQCPCCKGNMKPVRQVIRREQIEYSLLTSVSISSNPKAAWYGVRDSVLNSSSGARRVSPSAGRANQTMDPIEPPWLAIKEWIPDDEPNLDWFNRPRNPSNPDPDGFDQRPGWQPAEFRLDDGRTVVLDEF